MSLLNPWSPSISLTLYFKSFIVLFLHLDLWYILNYFFCDMVLSTFNFFFLHVYVLLFQHNLLKRLSFLTELLLPLSQRSVNYMWAYFCALCSINLFVCSFNQTTQSWIQYLYNKILSWLAPVFQLCSCFSMSYWLFWFI